MAYDLQAVLLFLRKMQILYLLRKWNKEAMKAERKYMRNRSSYCTERIQELNEMLWEVTSCEKE